MFEKDILLWSVFDSLENIFKVESNANIRKVIMKTEQDCTAILYPKLIIFAPV